MAEISDEPIVIAKKPLSRIDITNSDRDRLELEVHSGSLRDASPPGKNLGAPWAASDDNAMSDYP